MKTDWTAPPGAVEPANPFHTLYMRLAGITDAMLSNAPRTAIFESESFADLLGTLNSLSVQTAQLTRHLEDIRVHDPQLWEQFQRAFEESSHAPAR